MLLKELNENQIHQLKEQILLENNESISYGELVNADSLVSDLEVEERFGGITFVPEDFEIETNKELKIKVYPSTGAIFYVTLSEFIYKEDYVDEWIEAHLKNVEMWEYV